MLGKTIKKSSNTLFYIFIAVVIFVGLLPIFGILGWIGQEYFYSHFTPTLCINKLYQTNMMMQPSIQIGTPWPDGGTLYYVPQEIYIGNSGYSSFAKRIDTSICEQYITVKGTLQFHKDATVTTISPSSITLEITLNDDSRLKTPYQFTRVLQDTLLPYTPSFDEKTTTRIMRYTRPHDNQTDASTNYGFGFVSEINNTVSTNNLFITQHKGEWSVRNEN